MNKMLSSPNLLQWRYDEWDGYRKLDSAEL